MERQEHSKDCEWDKLVKEYPPPDGTRYKLCRAHIEYQLKYPDALPPTNK